MSAARRDMAPWLVAVVMAAQAIGVVVLAGLLGVAVAVVGDADPVAMLLVLAFLGAVFVVVMTVRAYREARRQDRVRRARAVSRMAGDGS